MPRSAAPLVAGPLVTGLLLAASGPVRADPAPRPAEVAAVTAYLHQAHPGANWQAGPLPLDGPAVRAAYPGRRFYTVQSHPPLPPGARLPGPIRAYQKAMAEWRSHHYISAQVAVDARGRAAPLDAVADFNVGLRPAHDERGLRTNAAAVLTVLALGLEVGPVAISADEVQLARTQFGWSATVCRASWACRHVDLDARGRLVGIATPPPRPMPPAALRRPAAPRP